MSVLVYCIICFFVFVGFCNWWLQLFIEVLIVLISLFFVVVGNGLFWYSVMVSYLGSLCYVFLLLLLLLGVYGVLLGILVWCWNVKVVISLLLLVIVFVVYYMSCYYIYLDVDMLCNVLVMDFKESCELMIVLLLWLVLLLVVLLMVVLWCVQLCCCSWGCSLLWWLGFLVVVVVIVVGGVLILFQDVLVLMCNQCEVCYFVILVNVLLGMLCVLCGDNLVQCVLKLLIGIDVKVIL